MEYPYHSPDESTVEEHIDMSGMANHDSLYSNSIQAAQHLIKKYDEEEARAYFQENNVDTDRIEEIIAEAKRKEVGNIELLADSRR